MAQPTFDNIRVVLVNTTHPGNVGATARAMKNMGLSRLYLVDPKDFPSPKAIWRAANAAAVLEQAVVVNSLADAIGDCGLVVGTSARERRIPWPLLTPRECGERTWAESAQHEVAIVFGREDRGLTNEELQQCHFHVHIPANPEYSSLNIGAAVQVICYEIRMAHLTAETGRLPHFDDWDMPPAKQQDLECYYTHLQETLEILGFLEPDNPRQTMTRLRRLYGRIRPDRMELSILRGILTATQNYIFHSNNKIKQLENSDQSTTDSQE
jgi:tRNA (cytidine32/uridine32-2'-O)-methyltransferase